MNVQEDEEGKTEKRPGKRGEGKGILRGEEKEFMWRRRVIFTLFCPVNCFRTKTRSAHRPFDGQTGFSGRFFVYPKQGALGSSIK